MSDIVTQTAPASSTEVATTQVGALLNFLERAARDPSIDPAKLSVMLDLQYKVLDREAEASFVRGLVAMNTDKLRVKKNGTVDLGAGKGSYPFAKWEDIDTVIRPIMQREGFVLSFDTEMREGGGLIVKATLLHVSGHSRTVSIPISLDTGPGRNNTQAIGSSLSYGRRYTTEMLLNIVREGDDDDAVRGGMRFIEHEQAEEVERLLTEAKADRAVFMAHFDIRSTTEIQVKDFTKIINALNTKKAKLAKESNS